MNDRLEERLKNMYDQQDLKNRNTIDQAGVQMKIQNQEATSRAGRRTQWFIAAGAVALVAVALATFSQTSQTTTTNEATDTSPAQLDAAEVVPTDSDPEEGSQTADESIDESTDESSDDTTSNESQLGSTFTLPDVTGMTADQAIDTLKAQVVSISTTMVASETVMPNYVVSQNPGPGQQVTEGSPVEILVSAGPAPQIIPNVAGLGAGAAFEQLKNAGFIDYLALEVLSESVPPGQVIRSEPSAGRQVAINQRVTLFVSSGSESPNTPIDAGPDGSELCRELQPDDPTWPDSNLTSAQESTRQELYVRLLQKDTERLEELFPARSVMLSVVAVGETWDALFQAQPSIGREIALSLCEGSQNRAGSTLFPSWAYKAWDEVTGIEWTQLQARDAATDIDLMTLYTGQEAPDDIFLEYRTMFVEIGTDGEVTAIYTAVP